MGIADPGKIPFHLNYKSAGASLPGSQRGAREGAMPASHHGPH